MPNQPKYPTSYVGIEPGLKAEIQEICKTLSIPFNQAVAEGLELWKQSKTKKDD